MIIHSKIDRVRIWDKIRVDADDLLEGTTTEMSFEIFANKCIEILDVEFDEYIFKIESEIGDNLTGDVRDAFLDFSTGYLAQMRKWIKDNPITKTKLELEVKEEVPQQKEDEPGMVKKIWVWIVNIFTKLWDFIKNFFNKLFGNEKKETPTNACEKEYMKDQFKQKVREDLDAWLQVAENKSEDVINSFDLIA